MNLSIRNIKIKRAFFGLTMTAALLGTGASCSKIDDVPSTRLASEETNWKTLEDAKANLMSIYGLMRSATVADNGHWLMGDLREGDFTITNRSDLKAVVNNQLNASYPVIERVSNWRRFYAGINAASLFIERSSEILELDPRYTELNNKVDIAQARMLRAYAYFYMSRIWGDVPLITSSHDGDFIKTERTSQDRVLGFATSELLDAAQVVPFRYGGTDPIYPGLYYGGGWSSWNGNVWTRLSAYIILAHIAAWQGNYIDAATYSKFVLDNQSTQYYVDGANPLDYINMDALTENQNNYSPFAYKRATVMVGFPFEAGNGLSTANGHIEQLTLASPFIPKSKPEMFVSKDSIINIFTDPKDLRFSKDLVSGYYRTNYFYGFDSELPIFNKIKVLYPSQTSGNVTLFSSSMVFSRMEEITLLRAEALAALGDIDGAYTALNKACNLRGIVYSTQNSPDVIKAIFDERRKELMGEGWRWYDIIRYQRLKRSNAPFAEKDGKQLTFKEFEDAGGIYWPVSQAVINANSSITQNPYWL
ncbi:MULTISPECIES: RagB/SusD family nutrient uptake outer membrane protein [unclassified Sphingobacterium]|uniref:RagB/SusD family nutrient uptake outer membrane protein n=1 Tax=unclassified Sphingobacterium TaxID=2609468 RepID=UPI000C0C0C09|nr:MULTISPECIES: RagB/SusD family nutrient uptake outer membrane protein [unclassified Sphingobacterium]NGM73624.1 RagB/SusD family nutrient uptake outer membrane protein [Sphingobacterium sp. SGL-16]